MADSLSKVVNNLPEGTHRIKCKFGHDEKKKKCETYGIKHKHCNCVFQYTNQLIHTRFLPMTTISLFYCC